MRKLLVFRIALYGTAVALIAFYFFGREGGEDDAVASGKAFEGRTAQGHPMEMYLDDGKVTYYDMDFDIPCPDGSTTTGWWSPGPEWADFRHSGSTFTAEERNRAEEADYTVDSIYTMRAELDALDGDVTGSARAVVRYEYRDGSATVCDSGDVGWSVRR